ncbi:MAG: hypothetical protein ACFFCO_11890 [Promethearchaeota archaeon]
MLTTDDLKTLALFTGALGWFIAAALGTGPSFFISENPFDPFIGMLFFGSVGLSIFYGIAVGNEVYKILKSGFVRRGERYTMSRKHVVFLFLFIGVALLTSPSLFTLDMLLNITFGLLFSASVALSIVFGIAVSIGVYKSLESRFARRGQHHEASRVKLEDQESTEREIISRRASPHRFRCIECGTTILGGKAACPHCGAPQQRCILCKHFIGQEELYSKCPHCGQLAHRSHLLEWIKMKGTCPYCKSRLRQSDIT